MTIRNRAAEIAQQTVRFCQTGHYASPSGQTVAIEPMLRQAREGTRSYPPGQPSPRTFAGEFTTRIEIDDVSILAAAFALVDAGERVAALNFASAKHPGGGFLGGARAQEESLCRSSGLHLCLVGNEMYAHHRASRDLLYSDYVIYSPDVPIFRQDNGDLLERPWRCSFLTSPAVNAGVFLQRHPDRRSEIGATMARRIEKVLTVAALHEHQVLVLGAWGCGVFQNDPAEIAVLFRNALLGEFRGVFRQVVFAVLDSSRDEKTIRPFRRAFPSVCG